jgi:hypothetical protein
MSKQLTFFVIVLVILVVLVAHVFAMERAERTLVRGGAAYLLKPAGRGGHTHVADLDARGDGVSSVTMGHAHAVAAMRAAPGADGHVHDLSQYIVPV